MLRRCYDIKCLGYKTYGAKGIYVGEEWLLFSNYYRWFSENYIDGYEVDKDTIGKGYYSPQTCIFISKAENSRESCLRRDYSNMLGEKNVSYRDISEYAEYPLDVSNFRKVCKLKCMDFNEFKPIYHSHMGRTKKYTWHYLEGYSEYKNSSYHEIKYKYSRRLISRYSFKSKCIRYGADFEDFIEIFDGDYSEYNNNNSKLYYYVNKEVFDETKKNFYVQG